MLKTSTPLDTKTSSHDEMTDGRTEGRTVDGRRNERRMDVRAEDDNDGEDEGRTDGRTEDEDQDDCTTRVATMTMRTMALGEWVFYNRVSIHKTQRDPKQP